MSDFFQYGLQTVFCAVIGDLILVSGDRGPVGAVSCTGLRDDGAFKSQRIRGLVVSVCSVIVVESATPTID